MAYSARNQPPSSPQSHPERLWVEEGQDFWPPRPSRFWRRVLSPIRFYFNHRHWKISEVVVEGTECYEQFGPDDGVIIAPNHSADSDAFVMVEVSRQAGQWFHFMAACQVFRRCWGIYGWALQRMGVFSVNREGADRRAIRQAIQLLTEGKHLVIFPEGEVYHLNERLTPLLEGPAFMALRAERELNKSDRGNRVWILPVAIQYEYLEDIRARLEADMSRLEAHLVWWKPPPGAPLEERILRFGEMLLTIKEKEKLGRSLESEGDLPSRISGLVNVILEKLEKDHLQGTHPDKTVRMRVKALRQYLLPKVMDDPTEPADRDQAYHALEEVQLALQLYSYPGDYVTDKPSLERMAETIDKFERDIFDGTRPKGRRRARVLLGKPIELSQVKSSKGNRPSSADVTARLEEAMQELINRKT